MSNDLFKAIAVSDSRVLSELLTAGANPNAQQTTWPRQTALQAAIDRVAESSLEPLRLLLLHGAEVDRRDGAGESTPLLMAVFRDQYFVVELLLEAGADVNARHAEGHTTLSIAAERGDLQMSELLLKHGAAKSINEPGGLPRHWTPLGAAAARSHLEMVKLLLAAGARPDARDADGRTAIEQAESCWRHVRELLCSSAEPER